MDETLIHFLKKIEVDLSKSFIMVNERGVERKFQVNWDDNTLQGRGIKGFFAPYDAEFLLIGTNPSGNVEVTTPNTTAHAESGSVPIREEDNVKNVMTAIKGFENDLEIWFQLYQIAQKFQMNTNDGSEFVTFGSCILEQVLVIVNHKTVNTLRFAERKGLNEEKVEEITKKSNVISIEMDKQLEEIKQKYHGHTEITIDHSILYFVPMTQYDIEIRFRSERKRQTLNYNLITKQFDRAVSQDEMAQV